MKHTIEVAVVSWLDEAEPARQPIRRQDRETTGPAAFKLVHRDRARQRVIVRRSARRHLAEVA